MIRRFPDRIVRRLIKIAEGGVVGKRRQLKGLWIFPTSYKAKLADQLDALRELGYSKNEIALNYIEKLSETNTQVEKDEDSELERIIVFHPGAKGPLARILTSYRFSEKDMPVTHLRYEEAIKALYNARDQLRYDLKKDPSEPSEPDVSNA